MSDSNMRTRHSSFGHIGQWWVGWRNQWRHLGWLWKINWERLMKLIKRDEPGHCLGPHQSHKCQADWRILFNNIHFPHFTFNEQLMYSGNLVRFGDTLDNIHRNGHWRKSNWFYSLSFNISFLAPLFRLFSFDILFWCFLLGTNLFPSNSSFFFLFLSIPRHLHPLISPSFWSEVFFFFLFTPLPCFFLLFFPFSSSTFSLSPPLLLLPSSNPSFFIFSDFFLIFHLFFYFLLVILFTFDFSWPTSLSPLPYFLHFYLLFLFL